MEAVYEIARQQFKCFSAPGAPIFFENAGGSQVPACVVDAVASYMSNSYVQLGAGYPLSEAAGAAVEAAHETARCLVNAHGCGHVVLGPSTSQLLDTLGRAYAKVLTPKDHVIVHDACHEANAGPWVRAAAASGARLDWWRVRLHAADAPADASAAALPAAAAVADPPGQAAETTAAASEPAAGPNVNADSGEDGDGGGGAAPAKAPPPEAGAAAAAAGNLRCASLLADLEALLKPSTKIVAIAHASNLIGEALHLERIVQAVKRVAPGAKVVVDGVAFAPHLPIDVAAWGVDWYAFSTYKVYGPHMAVLYGSDGAFRALLAARVPGPNHYFVPTDDFTYRWELGGCCHEAAAGLAALPRYLSVVNDAYKAACGPAAAPGARNAAAAGGGASGSGGGSKERRLVETAFCAMHTLEVPLIDKLLAYLSTKPDVVLIGPWRSGPAPPALLDTAGEGAASAAAGNAGDLAQREAGAEAVAHSATGSTDGGASGDSGGATSAAARALHAFAPPAPVPAVATAEGNADAAAAAAAAAAADEGAADAALEAAAAAAALPEATAEAANAAEAAAVASHAAATEAAEDQAASGGDDAAAGTDSAIASGAADAAAEAGGGDLPFPAGDTGASSSDGGGDGGAVERGSGPVAEGTEYGEGHADGDGEKGAGADGSAAAGATAGSSSEALPSGDGSRSGGAAPAGEHSDAVTEAAGADGGAAAPETAAAAADGAANGGSVSSAAPAAGDVPPVASALPSSASAVAANVPAATAPAMASAAASPLPVRSAAVWQPLRSSRPAAGAAAWTPLLSTSHPSTGNPTASGSAGPKAAGGAKGNSSAVLAPGDAGIRLPTMSFLHRRLSSGEISKALHARGFAVRNGHMYARRLVESLAAAGAVRDVNDGVVRISLLHYNTLGEVERLIAALEGIF